MSAHGRGWRAFGVSLALHVAVALATWNERLLIPTAVPAVRAGTETVELALPPEPGEAAAAAPDAARAQAQSPDLPHAYTDVPERMRSEEPPDRADYLALVNSRAADLLPGGDEKNRPQPPVEGELDQVSIRKQDPTAAPGVSMLSPGARATPSAAPPPAPTEPPADASATSPSVPAASPAAPGSRAGLDAPPGEAGLLAAGDPAAAAAAARAGLTEAAGAGGAEGRGGASGFGESGLKESGGAARPAASAERERAGASPATSELPDLFGRDLPSVFRARPGGDPGDRGFDFDQPAVGRPGGNTFIYGDYRLNTYAWNFAPWLQRFGQDLRRNWTAPYAYMLGVISGQTEMRVVIARDGRLAELAVQKEEGHPSLRQASEAALTASAPFAPLPADFPEENLVIILTLYYPAWRTPSPVEQPPAAEPGSKRPEGRH